MSKLKECILIGTTSTAGAATINATYPILGQLYAVEWVDGDLVDSNDAVISVQNTASGTSKTLLTLTAADNDALYYPRDLVHDAAGTALVGTAGGDRCLPLINGVLRLVIADGGSEKTGGCIVYYFE